MIAEYLLSPARSGTRTACWRWGRGRVARPFGFALTDPGGWLSRTRLFLHLPDKVATQVAYFNEIGKRDAVLISDVHLIDEEGCISHTQRALDRGPTEDSASRAIPMAIGRSTRPQPRT